MLTENEKYLERVINEGETNCPICNSENIVILEAVKNPIGLGIKQSVECVDCEETWKSRYSITTEKSELADLVVKSIKGFIFITVFAGIPILFTNAVVAITKKLKRSFK